MRPAFGLALFVLTLGAAVAQTQPDFAAILRKVGDTYKAASQYEIESEYTGRGAETTSAHMLLAFKPPNKYRMAGSISGLSGDAPAFGEPVIICDGSVVWFYLQESNQYASVPLSEMTPDAAGDLGDIRSERR
jgi:outer membrane lipoprotein-sorting protein